MRPYLFCMLTAIGLIYHSACHQAPPVPVKTDSTNIKLVAGFQQGETLFRQYCSSCHRSPKRGVLHNELLVGLFDRMPAPSTQYFIRYIQDSKALEQAGDPYALAVARDYNHAGNHHFRDSMTVAAMRSLIVYLRVAGSR
ncbi:c-type cytochrome [Chitinophaga varians]|uniref:c-type cytochrome n=1 Tax=Chitinophaga varians TaxID=2202339 RepID=UPI00165F5D51|nr:c-type cytochrome [Chitinophaga varians]MBC9913005.1 c-type cytochrome [Chitinophaga varians]